MRIQLVPSHASEPDAIQFVTTVLVNDVVAIDAGSLVLGLGLEGQRRVRHVIITHSHLDHTAGLPLFLSENQGSFKSSFSVHASRVTIASLRQHTFNDVVWPNFEKFSLPNGGGPVVRFLEIEEGRPFELEGLRFTPVATNHVVPTLGLGIEDAQAAVIVTSDTYRCDAIWALANRLKNLRAVFIDVSYPNELENLAALAKHLTPQSLIADLAKLECDPAIIAVHLKPGLRARIVEQLSKIEHPRVLPVVIGKTYEF
ncbi:MAG: 3',5'-cyclic-nucleotide phosphodiesterase [Planctomycetes bacterium]|nr:3',5'-cyclic-nucleotide phosphodiesterase [Planctomycetota bacterium]MBI3845897.1 3',5'-cyclic-nucleotide phosphodiesterase [Planctomycetota bacterium]